MPAGTEIKNAPSESLVADDVVGPVTVTVTPASVEPLAVVTVPAIVPVAACATITGASVASAGPTAITAKAKLAATATMRRRHDTSNTGSPKKRARRHCTGLMA